MLELTGVTKKYGGKNAVDQLNVKLESGRLVALMGPNGSGKTTMMKMVAGLIEPTAGEIRVYGEKVGPKTKARVAYMPTEAYFYSYMTSMDAGKYYRDFFRDFDMNRYEAMLETEKLEKKQKIRTMSSGMMAKLKLALTFSRNSDLVMLDEPLNGIDIIARERTLQMIRENHTGERTLIVSTHLVDELETMVDDVVFLKNGALVLAGGMEQLRQAQGRTLVDMYKEIYGEQEAQSDAEARQV